jgi:radical SAM protein (TIGR01212 family)
MNQVINYYSHYVKEKHGERIQKISIDAGFTCPNRDGFKGNGGCTFCNNLSFSSGNRILDITEQIERGITYFKNKNPNLTKFIVYFQSYTNTYAPLEYLKEIYKKALLNKQVIGLSIGTRPDCLENDKIVFLDDLSKNYDLTLEIGIESCHNETLKIINRGHDLDCFIDCLNRCRNKNFKIGTHIILGFPNETKAMMIQNFKILGKLPINFLKIHQLMIVKNTTLAVQYLKNPFPILTQDEYIEIVAEGLKYIPASVIIQRVFGTTKDELMVSQKWSAPANTTTKKLEEYMKKHSIYQGMCFK